MTEEVKEPNWIKIRLNNIGYKCAEDSTVGEFVLYYKNPDYKTLEKKLQNGWSIEGDYLKKGFTSMSKSLTELEELCYVIAYLRSGDWDCDLETVSSRLLDLSPEDREDFFEVYKIADRKMRLNYEE